MEKVAKVFDQLRHGKMNRRQLLQGLTLAAVAAATAEAAGGVKAVWLNHYTYVAPDLKKTRDWYKEVFGMQIGHEEAKLSHMWYGDKGDTLMIVRQANAGEEAPRIERFGFTVDAWDRKAIEAELKRRGLQPKADTDKGFWVSDPEGNEIGVFAKDFVKRPARSNEKPFLWKALSANHIVVLSPDYKKLGAWYKDLFNLRETSDAGRDVYQWFGDSVWIPTATREGGKSSAQLKTLDHVAYTIADYKSDAVAAELKRRKMISETANVAGSLGINCVDVNNFKTQVCDLNLVPDGEKRRQTGQRGGF
jgi:catechol 2,3-dioxygenase-like lactoylglutathione lyase family enzyme